MSQLDALFVMMFISALVGLGIYAGVYVWRNKERRNEINRQVIGILKSRYASGEIGREEFDEIRREIERV